MATLHATRKYHDLRRASRQPLHKALAMMTARQFAEHVNAKPVGRDRWRAQCRAHNDKSPSLAISVGRKQPLIFRCVSQNCSQADILKAMGLTWQAVMGTMTPEEERKAKLAEAYRLEQADKGRRKISNLREQRMYWAGRAYVLGWELAKRDSAETARLFHEALGRHRALDRQVVDLVFADFKWRPM